MFVEIIRENTVYRCKPNFPYTKWRLRGVYCINLLTYWCVLCILCRCHCLPFCYCHCTCCMPLTSSLTFYPLHCSNVYGGQKSTNFTLFGQVYTENTPWNFTLSGKNLGLQLYSLFFLVCLKHRLWMLVRTTSERRFWQLPTIYAMTINKKTVNSWHVKNAVHRVMKDSIKLHRYVIVMIFHYLVLKCTGLNYSIILFPRILKCRTIYWLIFTMWHWSLPHLFIKNFI